MKLIRQTTLRFNDGAKSDKAYEVDLVEVAGEYLVNFRYGKWGANLREGSKTKAPVELSKATKVADSLLVSKINKGYGVVSGFDPVSQQIIGEQSTLATSTPANSAFQANQTSDADLTVNLNERDKKIVQRLEKFYHNHSNGLSYEEDDTIDGYRFDRTLWKAGELRIKAVVPILQKILNDRGVPKDGLMYYSILWTLGRTADESALLLLGSIDFAKKLPANTDYMLTEVCMALSSETQALIPPYDDTIDFAQLFHNIDASMAIEKLTFQHVKPKRLSYISCLLDAHGIREEVEQALNKLTLSDALNEAFNDDIINQTLSPKTAQHIEDGLPAYPQLESAIDGLLEHNQATAMQSKAIAFQADFDHYKTVIATLDLNKVLSDKDEVTYAQQGRLSWIWGIDKRRLRKALKESGKVDNIDKLWDNTEQYYDLVHGGLANSSTTISEAKLESYYAVVRAAHIYDELMPKLENDTLDSKSWQFKYSLGHNIYSKIDTNLHTAVRELFNHQFHTLKKKASKPYNDQLKDLQNQALDTYWHALSNNNARKKILDLVNQPLAKPPFTQTFRRLYKMAEFRDDIEVLARLNYHLETTQHSPQTYWGKPKPFNKNTKSHFRLRLLRTLRHVAKFQSSEYPRYAKHVLLQANDSDEALTQYSERKQLTHFPSLSALNFILHKNSRAFQSSSQKIVFFNENINDIKQPEAYPELWQHAEQIHLEILLGCKAKLVNDFSFERLHKQSHFLTHIALDDWLALLQKPYENTAMWALNYIDKTLGVLTDTKVMQAILAAQLSSIRESALSVLDGESLGKHYDLLKLMLLSEHEDVHNFAKQYLYTAQAHYQTLSHDLIIALLATDNTQREHIMPRIEWLLLNPLKGQADLAHIKRLLATSECDLHVLATQLLQHSSHSFDELAEIYQTLSQSKHTEVRAGALKLLAKLELSAKISQQTLLWQALLDEDSRIRQASVEVIATIDDQAFQIATFDNVLPELFKAEPNEGFADDILQLITHLAPIHHTVDNDVLWRLLMAKSKLAQWSGAIILTAKQPQDFSVKQLALLSKQATASVRNWALEAFETDLSLTTEHYSQAIRILDNPWDDSRKRGIDLFKNHFDENFWNSQRCIAVCDSIYADVQRFGRDLVTRFFQQDDGEDYLRQLSQHPSANVQLFVSGFLSEYASNKPELIVSLQPYFKTVLSQVNKGRLIKDRVISFLFDEAKNNEAVASMVAELFSEQSVSRVVVDKMQYIKTLVQLQSRFTDIATPVRVIEPEVRAI